MASMEDVVEQAVAEFQKTFKEAPSIAACAPGRVNLIGEHTDYCAGSCLPMALPYVTVIVGRKSSEGKCRLVTCVPEISDKDRCASFPVPPFPPREPKVVPTEGPKWTSYVQGVVALMNEKGDVPVFDAVIASSVPLGGGLSSSAALEVATCLFVRQLCPPPGGQPWCEVTDGEKKEMALLCQQAEHRYAGVGCGIMDQFVSILAKEKHALLIDCKSQETEHVPIPFGDHGLVVLITNTQYKHQLAEKDGGEEEEKEEDNEYDKRRKGCESAASKLLSDQSGKAVLRDVTTELLLANRSQLEEDEFYFARHVVSEIRRTDNAVQALRRHDYQQFGQLMIESHDSLRDDLRVSCPELNHLVDLALIDRVGVLGSRMTGGGFGGCTVSLVRREALEWTKRRIEKRYLSRDGKKPDFYEVKPGAGARIIPKEELDVYLKK